MIQPLIIRHLARRQADRRQVETLRRFLLWSGEAVRTFRTIRNHPPRRDADRSLLVRLHASGWRAEDAAYGLLKWSNVERKVLAARS